MPSFWKIVNRVIDEADVILEVLDARLVDETRNIELEQKIEKKGKRLLYVINKCDLVDKACMDKKKKELRPSIFISSKDHLGTTMLKTRILEIGARDNVVAGVVGYPNTGKSSVINALSGRSKAGTSPQSGFTRGIQKIKAGPRIMLLDTPGVIPFKEDDEFKHAIIGTRDASKLKEPEYVASKLIEMLEGRIEKHYGVQHDKDCDSYDILEKIALKLSKLKKGGEPDTELAGRMIVKDWQQGKIGV